MIASDAIGYLASALVLAAFCMKEMIPLRVVAICSNIAFLVYGTIFLLLLAIVTAQHIHGEHNAATAGHHASVRSGN